MPRLCWILLALTLAGFTSPLLAQHRVAGLDVVDPYIPSMELSPEPAWGISDGIVSSNPAASFVPAASDAVYTYSALDGLRYRTGGSTFADKGIDLPSGAEIYRVELEGCDESIAAGIAAGLFTFESPGLPATVLAFIESTDAESIGCFTRSVDVTSSLRFVDKVGRRYMLRIANNGTTVDTRLAGVRVFYRLRISQPPASPTFGDVPATHPLYQFVEALAASGITGGCGGGDFCPNDPLTRGQMAVFLSKALGLHFPF